MNIYGVNVKKNVDLGISYLEKGIEKENIQCITFLCFIYFDGFYVSQDYEKSLRICLKYEHLKITNCLFWTGYQYYFGYGCNINISLGIHYLEESAKLENTNAQILLAIYYFINEEFEKSLMMMQRAEKNGRVLYYEELFTEFTTLDKRHQNFVEFIKNTQIETSITKIQLGLCYWHGYLVEKNLEKSFEYFQKSQDSNDPICLYYLGLFYKNGDIVNQDYQIALSFFENSYLKTFIDSMKLLLNKEIHFCKKKIKNNTKIIKYLGRGSFGSVFIVNFNNKEFVIKQIECLNTESANKALNEYQTVSKLKHRNICEMYNSRIDIHRDSLIVILEMKYYPLGSFEKYLNSLTLINEEIVKEFSIQILNGIN